MSKLLLSKNVLLTNVFIAKSFMQKLVGLHNKHVSRYIFMQTYFGIHTFFLRYPIDVVVLDEKNRVVKYKQSLKPNRLFFWNLAYNKVLELPATTIQTKKINIGDFIKLIVDKK